MDQMNHMAYLEQVSSFDVATLRHKEATYQGSWRKLGGKNAWAMARRKIDRLMNMLAPPSPKDYQNLRDFADNVHRSGDHASTNSQWTVRFHTHPKNMAEILTKFADAEDIFRAMDADSSGADGTVLAEVRDLRQYLLLFEARLMAEQKCKLDHVSIQKIGDLPNTVMADERLVPRAFTNQTNFSTRDDSNKHALACPSWEVPVMGDVDSCGNCGQERAAHSN